MAVMVNFHILRRRTLLFLVFLLHVKSERTSLLIGRLCKSWIEVEVGFIFFDDHFWKRRINSNQVNF